MEQPSAAQYRLGYAPKKVTCRSGRACYHASGERGGRIEKGPREGLCACRTFKQGDLVGHSYYHVDCFFGIVVRAARTWSVDDVATLKGFRALIGGDKKRVREEFVKPDRRLLPRKVLVIKGEGQSVAAGTKRKAADVEAEEPEQKRKREHVQAEDGVLEALSGHVVVVTGQVTGTPRPTIDTWLIGGGAKVSAKVSSATTVLITAAGGSKQKAQWAVEQRGQGSNVIILDVASFRARFGWPGLK
jgi:ribosomal protein L18E